METIEIEERPFHILGLKPGASLENIIRAYIKKTSQEKFKVVILANESLESDFKKYHRAYLNILRSHFESGTEAGLDYYPPDQAFRLIFNQGIYSLITQNYQKAGEKLEQAHNLKRQDDLVCVYLGVVLMKRKSYQAAEKYFNDAIKINKNNGDAWFYLGENYLKAGDLEKSREAFETAKHLNARIDEIPDKIKEVKDNIKSSPQFRNSFIKRLFSSKKK